MLDNGTTHQNRLQANPHLAGKIAGGGPHPPDGGEGACAAFGFLRGIRDRADAIEFRLASGNSVWFPYNWLGTVKFDPSAGLLLKFSGDLVYLVLIRGSNLNRPIEETGIDLIRAGLQRHRVLWVREMSEEDICQTGENGPTIDSIVIGEFETRAVLTEWLTQNAPMFL
ncbi:hypothetical protein SH668x_003704 [Planctomicrobium sp. SH668]|jgi:hypothetical protein|uniref:hypothetical protein n=1 Tax=Planctomicrobium sp. SH668 TaxID=3448126 RepID=UPI003F5B30C6